MAGLTIVRVYTDFAYILKSTALFAERWILVYMCDFELRVFQRFASEQNVQLTVRAYWQVTRVGRRSQFVAQER